MSVGQGFCPAGNSARSRLSGSGANYSEMLCLTRGHFLAMFGPAFPLSGGDPFARRGAKHSFLGPGFALSSRPSARSLSAA
jgi:hypothetical protein